MLIKHGLKLENLCIMKSWHQCRKWQCWNLWLHSADLCLVYCCIETICIWSPI